MSRIAAALAFVTAAFAVVAVVFVIGETTASAGCGFHCNGSPAASSSALSTGPAGTPWG